MGTLKEMVSNAVGNNKNKEIIVYCGVGGYASAAYFVLSEMLGYPKVKIYDGSAQEWTWQKKPVETC
jgi:thiosulfate/3-mercaptopyruvate sulfurtransferase